MQPIPIKLPKEGRPGLRSGLILTGMLLLGLTLWEIVLVELTGIGYRINSSKPAIMSLLINVSMLLITYCTIQKYSLISIHALLLAYRPTWKEYAIWGSVFLCINALEFLRVLSIEYYEAWRYVILSDVLDRVFITPFIEEFVFRGIFFAALRERGKILAYSGSTFLFVFWHIPSFTDLFMHGAIGLDNQHIFKLFLSGFIFAHIYETTGKLSLVVYAHSIGNAIVMSAMLFNCVVHESQRLFGNGQ